MRISGLNSNPQMSEIGAIHPCQTPQKNPAGFSTVCFPSPGMHPTMVMSAINSSKDMNFLLMFSSFLL